MSARPSKRFLFRRLKAELARERQGIGVDAASADFKNRRFFKTPVYLGLDIHEPSLRAGIMKHRNDGTLGVLCNLMDLRALVPAFAHVVVTTNTLHHIPRDARLRTVDNLIGLAKPGGSFLCECSIDDDFGALLARLQQSFASVRVSYYQNPISSAYERMFEVNGQLAEHPIASTIPFVALAELISRIEALTSFSPRANRHAFLVCRNRNPR